MEDTLIAIASDLVGVLIGSLLIAVVAQTACRISIRVDPPFGMAYKAVLLAGLASWLLGLLLGFVGLTALHWAVALLVSAVIDIATRGVILGKLIRNAKGTPIGFAKGARVAVIVTLIFTAVYAVFALVFGAAFML